MVRPFALAVLLAVAGADLSADQLAIDPSQEVNLLVQRTDLSSAALVLRIDRNCVESMEGQWPTYQSVELNALCVIGKSEIPTISSMRIVLFGLAAERRAQPVPTGINPSHDADDDIISSRLVFGYEARGRLLTYSDDVGHHSAFGPFVLEPRDPDSLLSFIACDTDWRGGGRYMPSLIRARCRSHGTIDGVGIFVVFDLVASTSRQALEGALTRAVRQVVAAEGPTSLNIPWRDPPG
jgi:hypothetical protein